MREGNRDEYVKRRICWPKPDATCLNGGCGWCNDHPFRHLSVIRSWAAKAGVLKHRGTGEEDALKAYEYGEQRGWPNVEKR